MFVKATNETKKVAVADRVQVAESFIERAKGLLGTASLPAGQGMLITKTRSVHSFFMRYPIDLIFLTRDGKVLTYETLKPWRFSYWIRQTAGVLEVPVGTILRAKIEIGDHVSLKPI